MVPARIRGRSERGSRARPSELGDTEGAARCRDRARGGARRPRPVRCEARARMDGAHRAGRSATGRARGSAEKDFALIRILGLLGLLLLSQPALAHKPSDSYLVLKAEGATIAGQWDIALRDLEYA